MRRISMLATVVAAIVLFSGAPVSASGSAASTPSAQVVLDWNVNAVTAVRAAKTMDGVPIGSPARSLYQTEGLVYMSYVQAAGYAAVTEIGGRSQPYHAFAADATGASIQAAVVSAAYHTLVAYLGDP